MDWMIFSQATRSEAVSEAQGYVAEMLHSLQALHWVDLFLGLGLAPYLVRYRVLRASGDSSAREVLDEGYRLLQEHASAIDDQVLRRSYLENVPANREIVATWKETSQESVLNCRNPT